MRPNSYNVTRKMNPAPRANAALLLYWMILALTIGVTGFFSVSAGRTKALELLPDKPILVIDPGHGGFDGGAISDDGTKESDLNLQIALRVNTLARLMGQTTVMTRADDSSRTEFSAYSEHEDLVHRASVANQTPGSCLLSIHQNDYPTGQPSGAQVLYAATDGSEYWGKLTHSLLISVLDPDNRRLAEPAPQKLFLTSHVTCPAILVECGFMSNNYDVLKLSDARYQSSLALVMVSAYLQFLSQQSLA